jgi:release factor glutamine methyltransferase
MARQAAPTPRLAGECLACAAVDLHAAGIELPVLEAQMLLAEAIGVYRGELYRLTDLRLTGQETQAFEELVRARCGRRPMAYIRGRCDFYGLTFGLTDAVLVPRPETELLVDFAIELARQRDLRVVVDIGTGSGCVAVSVAANCPAAYIAALDVSLPALAVAAANVRRHGIAERVCLLRCDLLTALRGGSVDLVLSNPPYIPSADIAGLQPEVRDHEPRLALDGGPDGLDFHRRLAHGAIAVLAKRGRLAVEVAMGQTEQVIGVHGAAGLQFERVLRDLAGIDRVVVSRLADSNRSRTRMRSDAR